MQYQHTKSDLTLTIPELMGRQFLRDTSRHAQPKWNSHVIWKGCSIFNDMQTKTKYQSLMEAELVAIDNALGQILWTRHFHNRQGIVTPDATNIYQDNKSMILLTENGKTSSSRHTKHLDIRYFL